VQWKVLANSDLSYNEVLFIAVKLCFPRVCTFWCCGVFSWVLALGFLFAWGLGFFCHHFMLLSFLESYFISRIYFPSDISNSGFFFVFVYIWLLAGRIYKKSLSQNPL